MYKQVTPQQTTPQDDIPFDTCAHRKAVRAGFVAAALVTFAAAFCLTSPTLTPRIHPPAQHLTPLIRLGAIVISGAVIGEVVYFSSYAFFFSRRRRLAQRFTQG